MSISHSPISRELWLDEDILENLSGSGAQYFPSFQYLDFSKVFKPFEPSIYSHIQQEIRDIRKAVEFPKSVTWSLLQPKSTPSTEHAPIPDRVKKILLGATLVLSTIGCLFLRIWKSQTWATHRIGRIALDTTLFVSVIGLIYLGVKNYRSRKNPQNDAPSTPPKAIPSSYQEELDTLRLIQYYSFMYDQLCTKHPGGRPADCVNILHRNQDFTPCFVPRPSSISTDCRIFKPTEFKAQLKDPKFQSHYRQVLEKYKFSWIE